MAVIQQQPGVLLALPSFIPPGLECLTQMDGMKVKQNIEMLEVITGFEMNNRYIITDPQGMWLLFNAKENTDCCTRICCGPRRPFDLEIFNPMGLEVSHLIRPWACQSCCFPCCLQRLEVYAPIGQLIGVVEQEWSLWIPKFVLKDANGRVALRINGPMCTCSLFCDDVQFDVMAEDGTPVGNIWKRWTGFCKEALTDADNFDVSFPIDLDVKMKAVMLGALFLIDFMYFEKAGRRNH